MSEERKLDIEIGIEMKVPDIQFEVRKGTSADIQPETYEGAYEVESKLAETQILPTRAKLMKADMVVDEIPVYRVSNETGGYTYYIGR